jgi:alpha-ketoglutarate-dependent 2,4-dichlorophenoxyacetate dioxygenase
MKSPDTTFSKNRFDYEELLDISNVDADGTVASADSKRVLSNLANQLWHSDSSFQEEPVSFSMLSAVVCPPAGGNTEFADMRGAYDALDAATKTRLEGLSAEHFAFHSREMLGAPITDAERSAIPPAHWPVVRKQAGTERRSLFIGVHARSIDDMPTAQGRLMLLDLLEHATQPAFVYRHEWKVGDFVIWDNRTTLHRGRPFDVSQRRELRRTTILEGTTTTQ